MSIEQHSTDDRGQVDVESRMPVDAVLPADVAARASIPGLPRTPNADLRTSSSNNGPNRSRTFIAKHPLGNSARATWAVDSGTSDHARGCSDTNSSTRMRDKVKLSIRYHGDHPTMRAL